MKKNVKTIILVLILLVGLSLLLYPTFSEWWNAYRQSQAVASYAKQVDQLGDKNYEAIWRAALEYNRALLQRTDRYRMTQEQTADYESQLVVAGSDVMGYIAIPELEVTLPIRHGTGDSVLEDSVGHLEWSSLPVGGAGSHCVLVGHRGLPGARLFTDLVELEVGDVFLLYILDEVLIYQVDQILVVEPDDVEPLQIAEGEDYCTLVTCTPYGVNSHRLLVRGRRIEE